MTHSNSDQRLASIVQRIERLAEEKRGLTSDIADIYKEAAGSGYDKKALRALIRERQREGISLAKQRGVYRGRKKALSSERETELRRRASAGEPKAKLAREFGVSRETLYQYLKVTAP